MDFSVKTITFEQKYKLENNKTHIYFASDFHLGVPNYASSLVREKKICAWMESIRHNAAEIYLVGDVFDFWFEYKHVVPKGYTRLLGKLSDLSDQGIKITFFKGNHDMWTFGYLEKEIGAKIVSNELEIERNGKRFYIHHGDGIGPGDNGYKMIKKIFRSKLSVKLFGFLHPYLGVGLANFLSRRSRISKGNKDKIYLGEDNEFIIIHCKELLKKKHVDFFICGHRHLEQDLHIQNNSRYINLGEWVNDFTYAEFDGINLELKQFQ